MDDDTRFHYVDGGYVENTGSATMLEVLQTLQKKSEAFKNREVVPFVFVLKFSDAKDASNAQVTFANEFSEILLGIYNTRSGRSEIAQDALRHFTIDELQGRVIELSIEKSGSKVPLNWVFSTKSLQNLKDDIDNKWKNWEFNDLKNLYIMNKDCSRNF